MKIVQRVANELKDIVDNKNVLEIACGDSDFSMSITKYALSVLATDVSLERFTKRGIKEIPKNLSFSEMDASKLDLVDEKFDVVACYNALAHLDEVLEKVLAEILRVLKTKGYALFITTWKIEKFYIKDVIEFYKTEGLNNFSIIEKKDYNIYIFQKD